MHLAVIRQFLFDSRELVHCMSI